METKQVTLKNKVIVFVIFYIVMNRISFWWSNGLMNVEDTVGDFNNVNIDGTDFTPAVDLFASGFNLMFTLVSIIITSIFHLGLILMITAIFNSIYFRTLCVEKDKLKGRLKKIIWGFSGMGIVLSIVLNIGQDATIVFFSIVLIYLPLPMITSLMVFSKFKKTYEKRHAG